jgi:hypothetical protein
LGKEVNGRKLTGNQEFAKKWHDRRESLENVRKKRKLGGKLKLTNKKRKQTKNILGWEPKCDWRRDHYHDWKEEYGSE